MAHSGERERCRLIKLALPAAPYDLLGRVEGAARLSMSSSLRLTAGSSGLWEGVWRPCRAD
jgi:hypothetical protein